MDACGARRGCWAVLVASSLVARPAIAAPTAAAAGEAPPATAEDPNQAEAQRLFEKGAEAYNLGRFDAAIESFERAYELSQANALLYNIAQAYTKLYDVDPDAAHLRKAKMMFVNFAKIAEATGEDARDARARVTKIDEQIAAHEARAEEEERRAEEEKRRAEAAERERREIETRRLEAAAKLAAAQRYRPRKLGIAGWTTFTAGMLGGWTITAIGGASVRRLEAQREAESLLPLSAERGLQYDENILKAQVMRIVGFGVGFVLVVSGITMIAVDAVRTKRAARRVGLVPGGLRVAF